MDNQLQSSNFESFELGFSSTIQNYLKEAAKWANFLAILGFVGIGLMVLLGVFVSFVFGAMDGFGGGSNPYSGLGISGGMLGLFYIVIALFYFFPVLYMYKFSRKMKSALYSNDTGELTESFKNLKSLFKFMGILAIVIISLYVLIFLFAALGTAFF